MAVGNYLACFCLKTVRNYSSESSLQAQVRAAVLVGEGGVKCFVVWSDFRGERAKMSRGEFGSAARSDASYGSLGRPSGYSSGPGSYRQGKAPKIILQQMLHNRHTRTWKWVFSYSWVFVLAFPSFQTMPTCLTKSAPTLKWSLPMVRELTHRISSLKTSASVIPQFSQSEIHGTATGNLEKGVLI